MISYTAQRWEGIGRNVWLCVPTLWYGQARQSSVALRRNEARCGLCYATRPNAA